MQCWEERRKESIVEALLLHHDGLLTAIIQWGYWDAEHRSDIVNEVAIECELIVIFKLGRDLPMKLVGDAFQWNDGSTISTIKARNRVQDIGMTSIVGKAKKTREWPTLVLSSFESSLQKQTVLTKELLQR